jgi:DNA-binding LytR/AlgR family response regulator
MTTLYIVEDMAMSRLALHEMSEDNEFCVAGSSATGEKALLEIEQLLPDLILIDINLAGHMSGITLARLIRARTRCKIIFLTAYGDDDTLKKVMKVEPEGYIMKPYNMPTVVTAIKIALTLKRPQIKGHDQKNNYSIAVSTGATTYKINNNSLRLISTCEGILYLHTKDQVIEIRSSLKRFLERYPDFNLVQVHQSYAVNPKCISSISRTCIKVEAFEVPIGRTYFPKIDGLRKFRIQN